MVQGRAINDAPWLLNGLPQRGSSNAALIRLGAPAANCGGRRGQRRAPSKQKRNGAEDKLPRDVLPLWRWSTLACRSWPKVHETEDPVFGWYAAGGLNRRFKCALYY
jgi:hypothetical protein